MKMLRWLLMGLAGAVAGSVYGNNIPPLVSLAAPEDGWAFVQPAVLELIAEVKDEDGWVATVEFFAGDRLLGSVTPDPRVLSPINPFRFAWKEPAAGEHRLLARAIDDDGNAALSAPVTVRVIGAGQPAEATLVMRQPADGAMFTAPAGVLIEVVGVDPLGDIRHVEFFAGEKLIGRSDHWTRDAVIPGRPRVHSFVWREAGPGRYELWARAKSTAGQLVVSKGVGIEVQPLSEQARVTILALKPRAAEVGDSRSRTAIASVARTGPVDFALPVFYSVAGSATPGEDFSKLSGQVVIPVGDSAAQILVEALPDARVEGEETVLLRVEAPACIEIFPPPRECYQVGDAREARLLILDGDATTNERPQVEITTPASGANFRAPVDVPVRVGARDADGYVPHVEFYANGNKIGEATLHFIQAPPPGEKQAFEWTWKDVPAGRHALTVKAIDDQGASRFSSAVGLTVAAPPPGLVPLVRASAKWKYRSDGQDLGTAWREANYDDSHWQIGAAQLGYGDGDEATKVPTREPHPITAYFRHAFEAPALGDATGLALRLLRDDGAVVYLNGKEVYRSNLPDGDIKALTLASEAVSGDGEDAWHEASVALGALTPGKNVLAVEVHQISAESSDLSFDLELAARRSVTEPLPVVSIVAGQAETREPAPNIRVIPGSFLLNRGGAAKNPLVVFLEFEGTAKPGSDYTPIAQFVEFPAGVISVEVKVMALADELVEGDETVIAKLTEPPFDRLPDHTIDPRRAIAKVVIHDSTQAPAPPARLEITAPKDGSEFAVGAPIAIAATAVDPQGYINRVEFFANDQRIGVSEIVFIRAPDPGTPIYHTLEWNEAAPGRYTLSARAVSSAGVKVISEPVTIIVGNVANQVVLEIEATDPVAVEPAGADAPLDRAEFTVRRVAGPREVEVRVVYSLGGSALNGVDYAKLSGELTLAKGADAARLVVEPRPDKALEGEESIVVALEPPPCILIFPPPPWCYLVGAHGAAKAVLRDAPGGANHPPIVLLTSPKHGAVFSTSDTVPVRAKAADADGTIERLDVHVGDRLLGSAKLGKLEIAWKPEAPGTYELSARAIDDDGAVGVSQTVRVVVRREGADAFVWRELPPAYTPGVKFPVVLRVQPPRGSRAHAVEDQPPAGWIVSGISDDGSFDAATGKVKFGPFTSTRTHTLSYSVMPPGAAQGRVEFHGVASVDGRSVGVAGEEALESGAARHPADRSPADDRLTITEVTAYAAAWKSGATWPEGPVPIPLTYVTRAGALWKGGESYTFDPTRGPAPLWWVNVNASPNPGAGASAAAFSRVQLEPALAGAAVDSATRHLQASCAPGESVNVRLALVPASGTTTVAVEEELPEGWDVLAVSDEGVFDAAQRRLRWGVFFSGEPRELSYTLAAPSGVASHAAWIGTATFDGRRVAIQGIDTAVAADARTAVSIDHAERHGARGLRLQIRGAAGQICALEVSSDLTTWTERDRFYLAETPFAYTDDGDDDAGARFYRVRPIGGF